jgi:NAD(P)-dependent dehydrogenase (short-subunit alcohol dehydrogenase family)
MHVVLRNHHPYLELYILHELYDVIDVLSIASGLTVGAPFMIAYHLSKSSLIHMTKNLVTPLAADNIIINAICPGWFPTKMSKV